MSQSEMSAEITQRALALCKSPDGTYHPGALKVCARLWGLYGDEAIDLLEKSGISWYDIYILADALRNDYKAVYISLRDGTVVDTLKKHPDSSYNYRR